MNDKIKIGEIIKSKRRQHGFTQKEFANLLNVSDKAVSNWEQGKNYPDIVLFDEIVKVLQIEMEVLLRS